MKNFFIITNKGKEEAIKARDHLMDYLRERGAKVTADDTEYNPESVRFTDKSLVPDDTECIIVLGGDGTIIHAAVDLKVLDIPILGINLGTLGYLSEADSAGMYEAVERLLKDDYSIKNRMMLYGRCFKDGYEMYGSSALNEVALVGVKPMQMIQVSIFVNDRFIHKYEADGLIVATPTGSTGYNLSAGGPIVNPEAKTIIITPICSHAMHNRSIVFSPDDVVKIVVDEGRYGDSQDVLAVYDGAQEVPLSTGDEVIINQSDYSLGLIKLREESFLDTLHHKLSD